MNYAEVEVLDSDELKLLFTYEFEKPNSISLALEPWADSIHLTKGDLIEILAFPDQVGTIEFVELNKKERLFSMSESEFVVRLNGKFIAHYPLKISSR